MRESRYHQKKKIVELLQSESCCGSISTASRNIGVSRQIVYEWRRQDKIFDLEVKEAVNEGKELLADLAESALVTKIKNGDITAIIFTLKNLRKERYAEKDEKKETPMFLHNTPYDSFGDFTKPIDALLMTSMLNAHNQGKAKDQNVLTPEVVRMFEEIKCITDKYYNMIK